MHIKHQKHVLGVGAVLAGVVVIASVFSAGFSIGQAQTKNINIVGLENGTTPAGVSADFSVFWQAWDLLKSRQLHSKDTSSTELVGGAIKGLAGSFDDPYTVYFSPADSKTFNEEVVGNFGGIGAEIGIKNEQLIIVAPLKGSPAEKAGLKPKDQILEINGKGTTGLTVEDAVKLIRGDVGTKVTLTIFRSSWDKPKKIEIVRDNIKLPTVDSKIDSNGFLHLSLYQFNANAESAFQKAILDGLNQGAKGLILDLRNNPGGYLDVAVNLAGWFLDKGSVVVKQRDASGNITPLKAYGNESLKNFPTVVLINEGSASASEILAGALRDDRHIKLIGEKSFGKGTVQELDPLKDGSTLKITIANWLTPTGQLIDKTGITPDYVVALDDLKFAKDGTDTQLVKADEVLKSQISSR